MKHTSIHEITEFLNKIVIEKSEDFSFDFSLMNYIKNPAEIVVLALKVIQDDEYLNESTLAGFQDDFSDSLSAIIEGKNIDDIERATKRLAVLFESFLRIIAISHGYNKSEIWNGNVYSKGIIGTSVGGLLMGKLENTSKGKSENIKQIKLPEKLLHYRENSLQQQLADFVINKIRIPASHKAIKIDKAKVVTYSQRVVLLYFLTIQDNFEKLSKKYLPQFKYLQKVIESSEYKNLDTVYVDLFGKDYSDIDVHGSKVSDLKNIIQDIEHFNLFSNLESKNINLDDEEEIDVLDEELSNGPTSILEIYKAEIAFFLIGDPGAGKTTTLLKILFQNSKRILAGEKLKIPVFLPAKEFSFSNNFLKMIHRIFGEEWSLDNFKLGNFSLLIDGLNEISETHKTDAINQIDELMKDFPGCSFMFSERKLSFQKYFDIPVYELKSLDSNQIKDFVFNYGNENSIKIWTQLSKNQQLLELASNPLMLKMILSISKMGDIPANKGKLYDLFIRAIFEREEKKRHQINYEIKIEALAKVGFMLRSNGEVSCNKYRFKNLLKEALIDLKTNIDLEELIRDLNDNYIIKTGENNEVSFIHESYLEYFVAYSLMVNFNTKGGLQLPTINDNWVEPIQLCIGLINSENQINIIINSIIVGSEHGHIKKTKYLNDFHGSDFNSQIYIASRIGYSCKEIYPAVYKRIEQVLINYLTLWKFSLFNRGTEQVEIDILIKSVAFINSDVIYKLIFINSSWVHLWLCSYEDLFKDHENYLIESQKISSNQRSELFRKISTSLVSNATDIFVILKYIDLSLNEYGKYFQSVQKRLSELKRLLIKNGSYKELKKYYLSNSQKNGDIILKLIEINIEDIFLYKFTNYSVKQNTKVLDKLLAFHHHNANARKIVVEQIKLGNYRENKIIDFLYYLLFKGYVNDVIEISKQLINTSIVSKGQLAEILREINWEVLPENLRALFTINNRRKNKYKILYQDSKNISICNYSKNKLLFEVGSQIYSNRTSAIVISKSPYLEFIISCNENYFNDIINNFQSLILCFEGKEFELVVLSTRITHTNKLAFIIDTRNIQLDIDFKILKRHIIKINNNLKFQIDQVNTNYFINIEGEIDKLFIDNGFLFVENNNDKKLNIEEIEQLYFHPSIENISPKLYKLIIEELKNDNEKLLRFLLKNRLINSYISDNSISANFGIVTNNNKEHKKCCIYFPINHQTIESNYQNNLDPGSIILFDESDKIHRINLSCNLRKILNSRKGVIIKFEKENNIGFIYDEQNSMKMDYFFSAKSCNFYPNIGDKVEFIACPSPIEKYRGKWVAYNIVQSN